MLCFCKNDKDNNLNWLDYEITRLKFLGLKNMGSDHGYHLVYVKHKKKRDSNKYEQKTTTGKK